MNNRIHKIGVWIILIAMSSLMSCLPKQEVLRHPGVQGPERPSSPTGGSRSAGSSPGRVGTSAAGWHYIETYKTIAIEEMNRHGIPASIKLAQGILESGNGTSRLAVEANNHFGIKCTTDWSGGRSYHDDDAENDCFRVYSRAEESFRDHSQFLLRRRYEKLFTLRPGDYKAWARGLKEAGYATNPRYADLLIDLIERYELYQFDSPNRTTAPGRVATQTVSTTQTAPTIQNAEPQNHATPIETVSKPALTMKIHEVASGETITSIAPKYGLTAQEIIRINGLKNGDLHPGQLLVVSKM